MTRFHIKVIGISAISAGIVLGAAMFPALASAKAGAESQPCSAALNWEKVHKERSIAQRRALEAVKPSDLALAKALSQHATLDQTVREALIHAGSAEMNNMHSPAWKKVRAVDARNLAWLKPEIESHGFPTVAKVGLKGVTDAWLLVQHAGRDPSFQEQVLAEIEPRLVTEPFLRSEYALLVDRVRLAQGKKQLYGTQLTLKGGKLVLQPTEDMATLSERRTGMDLMPMSDYTCEMQQMYQLSAQSKHTAHPAPARS